MANGETLPFTQEEVTFNGWAIECRISAENPRKTLCHLHGTIQMYLPPGWLRSARRLCCIPRAMQSRLTPDSMVAKLIVHAPTREEAIERDEARVR